MYTENMTVLAECPVAISVKITPWDMECLACDAGLFGSWWGVLRLNPETNVIRAVVANPDNNEQWARYRITPQRVANAISELIENGWDTRYPSGALSEFAATGDFGGGYDSVVADGILQQAIFDEIIYG
jgi:hypothetical protein